MSLRCRCGSFAKTGGIEALPHWSKMSFVREAFPEREVRDLEKALLQGYGANRVPTTDMPCRERCLQEEASINTPHSRYDRRSGNLSGNRSDIGVNTGVCVRLE